MFVLGQRLCSKRGIYMPFERLLWRYICFTWLTVCVYLENDLAECCCYFRILKLIQYENDM